MKITLSRGREYYLDNSGHWVICTDAVLRIFGRLPKLSTFEFSNQPLEHSVTLDPLSDYGDVVVRGPNGGRRVEWMNPRLCNRLVAGGIDLKQRMWFRMYEGKVE